MEARCRRFAVSGSIWAMEKQFPLEPMQLRFNETFPRAADRSQRISQHFQSRLRLARVLVSLGQQGQKIGPPQLGAVGLVGGQILAYLGNALLTAPLLSQRPTPPTECGTCFSYKQNLHRGTLGMQSCYRRAAISW